MSIKTVNVFLNHCNKKLTVGRLAYKNKIIYFEYDKEFLGSGLELSPYKLALKTGVHVCDDNVFEGLFGLFADSLPDGWGRLLLDRHFLRQDIRYDEITPLDRLCYIGSYGVGALSYEPVVENMLLKDEDIILDSLAQDSLEILKGSSQNTIEKLLILAGSSAGARPKAMIQLSKDKKQMIHASQKLQTGFSHWMVKFPSSTDIKDIGKIEYAYSLMAKDANIDMPQTTLLKDKQNSYFAIKRFDRISDNPVHIHSVAGLVHSDFRLPSLDYDDLLTLTLHITKDVNEQLKMFRLACFNLFSHNRDDHAKNFSFLMDSFGNWKLTPAYDLTFSYGPGGEHSTTYLGEGKNPTRTGLIKLGKKHTIKGYEEIIDNIESIVNDFVKYAKIARVDKQAFDLIFKVIRRT